jgi:hypothetical protein
MKGNININVSQFKDVDQETDKPHFIKNGITALPTNFGTRGLCKFKQFFVFKEKQKYHVSP